MPCEPFSIVGPDGRKASGFICSRRRRERCQVPGCDAWSTALCDYPVAGGKRGKTCSMRLCDVHRHEQTEPNADGSRRDYCPPHHARAIAAATPAPAPVLESGDPFVDAVKRGAAKLEAGEALPWWALVTAAAAMRASATWSEIPEATPLPPCAGEFEALPLRRAAAPR